MKMLNPKTLLILLLLFCTVFFCEAQSDWKDGYIIKHNHDTLKGKVKMQVDVGMFKSIEFKGTDGVVKIESKDVKAYGILMESQMHHYISRMAKLEVSSKDLSDASDSPMPEYKNKLIFAQLLVDGTKGLYYHMDENGKKHFLVNEADTLIDLVNKIYYTSKERTETQTNQLYKFQLSVLLVSCKNISEKEINETPYNDFYLSKIFARYNTCGTNYNLNYKVQYPKNGYSYGVVGGFSKNTLTFISAIHPLRNSKYDPCYSVNIGAFYNIAFAKTNKKICFYNEILYNSCKFKNDGYYWYFDNSQIYKKSTQTFIEWKSIKLFSALRVEMPINKFIKPFVKLGLVNSYSFGLLTKQNIETISYFDRYESTETLLETRNYEQSIFAGLGGSYKKMEGEIRLERGNGMSVYTALNSRTHYLYFLLKYKL